MTQVDIGLDARDRRGDWRPRNLLAPAPLLAWPVKPLVLPKWLFGWEGYLFPWNAIYISVATAEARISRRGIGRMRM